MSRQQTTTVSRTTTATPISSVALLLLIVVFTTASISSIGAAAEDTTTSNNNNIVNPKKKTTTKKPKTKYDFLKTVSVVAGTTAVLDFQKLFPGMPPMAVIVDRFSKENPTNSAELFGVAERAAGSGGGDESSNYGGGDPWDQWDDPDLYDYSSANNKMKKSSENSDNNNNNSSQSPPPVGRTGILILKGADLTPVDATIGTARGNVFLVKTTTNFRAASATSTSTTTTTSPKSNSKNVSTADKPPDSQQKSVTAAFSRKPVQRTEIVFTIAIDGDDDGASQQGLLVVEVWAYAFWVKGYSYDVIRNSPRLIKLGVRDIFQNNQLLDRLTNNNNGGSSSKSPSVIISGVSKDVTLMRPELAAVTIAKLPSNGCRLFQVSESLLTEDSIENNNYYPSSTLMGLVEANPSQFPEIKKVGENVSNTYLRLLLVPPPPPTDQRDSNNNGGSGFPPTMCSFNYVALTKSGVYGNVNTIRITNKRTPYRPAAFGTTTTLRLAVDVTKPVSLFASSANPPSNFSFFIVEGPKYGDLFDIIDTARSPLDRPLNFSAASSSAPLLVYSGSKNRLVLTYRPNRLLTKAALQIQQQQQTKNIAANTNNNKQRSFEVAQNDASAAFEKQQPQQQQKPSSSASSGLNRQDGTSTLTIKDLKKKLQNTAPAFNPGWSWAFGRTGGAGGKSSSSSSPGTLVDSFTFYVEDGFGLRSNSGTSGSFVATKVSIYLMDDAKPQCGINEYPHVFWDRPLRNMHLNYTMPSGRRPARIILMSSPKEPLGDLYLGRTSSREVTASGSSSASSSSSSGSFEDVNTLRRLRRGDFLSDRGRSLSYVVRPLVATTSTKSATASVVGVTGTQRRRPTGTDVYTYRVVGDGRYSCTGIISIHVDGSHDGGIITEVVNNNNGGDSTRKVAIRSELVRLSANTLLPFWGLANASSTSSSSAYDGKPVKVKITRPPRLGALLPLLPTAPYEEGLMVRAIQASTRERIRNLLLHKNREHLNTLNNKINATNGGGPKGITNNDYFNNLAAAAAGASADGETILMGLRNFAGSYCTRHENCAPYIGNNGIPLAAGATVSAVELWASPSSGGLQSSGQRLFYVYQAPKQEELLLLGNGNNNANAANTPTLDLGAINRMQDDFEYVFVDKNGAESPVPQRVNIFFRREQLRQVTVPYSFEDVQRYGDKFDHQRTSLFRLQIADPTKFAVQILDPDMMRRHNEDVPFRLFQVARDGDRVLLGQRLQHSTRPIIVNSAVSGDNSGSVVEGNWIDDNNNNTILLVPTAASRTQVFRLRARLFPLATTTAGAANNGGGSGAGKAIQGRFQYEDIRVVAQRQSNSPPTWDYSNEIKYNVFVDERKRISLTAVDLDDDLLSFIITKAPQFGILEYETMQFGVITTTQVKRGGRIRIPKGSSTRSDLFLQYYTRGSNTFIYPVKDSFTVVADDGGGVLSEPITVTVNIVGDRSERMSQGVQIVAYSGSLAVFVVLLLVVVGCVTFYFYRRWARKRAGYSHIPADRVEMSDV